MIAWTEAQRAGLFVRQYWLRNVIAGIIVGVVALPLSMAFAIATGVKPEQGIYTAIVAGVIVSVFGGSRVQIAGPTGAFIAILAGITATYGINGLQVATFLAGVMLLLMGLFRLGAMIRFIPMPVILGFTAGIGVVIWVGQWAAFFGLPKAQGAHFHAQLSTVAFGNYRFGIVVVGAAHGDAEDSGIAPHSFANVGVDCRHHRAGSLSV